MLSELRVANFALIEQLQLTVPSGFVVLTGETGAGKSLLIDAISLLLGQRAAADLIRTGSDEAELEAAFSFSDPHPALQHLRALDLLGSQESELIVRRVLSRSGRSRTYVNTRLVPLQCLEQLSGVLVDIHGQHEQQSLLRPAVQLAAVDAFGSHDELRGQYERAFERWRLARRAVTEAETQAQDLRQREDLLRFQWKEIQDAAPTADEDQQLHEELQRLRHADKLQHLSDAVYHILYQNDGAVLAQLAMVERQMQDLTGIDRASAEWLSEIRTVEVKLRDMAEEIRRYRDRIAADPSKLAEAEDRMALLERLKKRYGGTLAEVRRKGDELSATLSLLDHSQHRLQDLQEAELLAFQEVRRLADQLSVARERTAALLERRLQREFTELQMPHARLQVKIERNGGDEPLGPAGQDRAEFHFSANRGEPLRPLARVASGGEMSRVMLGLKTALAAHDTIPTLIFDEIDAGVGGATAEAIGRRLRALAAYHQVLCVTHLPQVASQAHAHILVEKKARDRRTQTSVRLLDVRARSEEIAKMLGGQTVTAAMRRAAAELLGQGGEAEPN
ncbi:MAG: DNA repair protein RecN [Nitrospiraceae bacterium]